LGIGQLANLEELGNLYNIIGISDREFHNARGKARIRERRRGKLGAGRLELGTRDRQLLPKAAMVFRQ
jgi:hypothetical protein